MINIGLYGILPNPNEHTLCKVGTGSFWKLYKSSKTKDGSVWKIVGWSK